MTVALPDPYVGGPVEGPEELRQRFEAIQRNFEAIATEFPLRAQHIANDSISSDQIVNATITATDIANATIIGANIANATIVGANIANATIAAANIVAGTITANEIADATITANEIADATITAQQIANATITAAQIANATITGTQIASATILGANIASGTIVSSNIQDASITGSDIASLTITAANIGNSEVTANKIAAGSIDTAHLTATAIDGMTITGSTIRTSASDPKVEMTSAGIAAYDSSGEVTFSVDSDTGKVTTLAGVGGPNMVPNSGFESTDLSRWAYYGTSVITPVRSTTQKRFGTHSLKAELSGGVSGQTWVYLGIVPADAYLTRVKAGDEVTHSMYVYPTNAGRTFTLGADYYDDADVFQDFPNVSQVLPANQWTRMSMTAVAPTDGYFDMGVEVTAGATAGDVFYIDGVQAEMGRILTAYGPRPDEILRDQVTEDGLQDNIFSSEALVDQFFSAGTIHGDRIVADSIAAGQIAADSISTSELAAGSVTATEISVSQLSAIAADLGTITAGTITGATVRTAASGERIEITSSELAKYDSGGNKALRLTPANGLELLSATSLTSPENDRSIYWRDGSANDVAWITVPRAAPGPLFVNNTRLFIQAKRLDDASAVSASLITLDENGDSQNSILLSYDKDELATITVQSGAESKGLLDGTGASDWEFKDRYNLKTVTSLPGSPVDGQEVLYLADSTNGVVWHLKYRAASGSSYKWEYIGGPPLLAEKAGGDTPTSTTYITPATQAGPDITVPLAGDYDVTIFGYMRTTTATGSALQSYAVGGAAAVDADSIQVDSAAASMGSHTGRTRRKTGLAASTALVTKIRVTAGTGAFRDRSMMVTPVRVG